MKNYAKLTKRLTGMTTDQYEKAYTKFAARVRNYNSIAGTNYKAAQQFYYSFRFEDGLSPALQAIQKTPATRPRTAGAEYLGEKAQKLVTKLASNVLYDKWGAFIQKSRNDQETGFGSGDAAKVSDALEHGLVTVKEADEMLRRIKEGLSQRREDDPSYRY